MESRRGKSLELEEMVHLDEIVPYISSVCICVCTDQQVDQEKHDRIFCFSTSSIL